MESLTRKSVAVFSSPFKIRGFDETLPAGEYDIETESSSPPDCNHPQAWKASVLVKLHPRESHPGLARTLTVSLADLDMARASDRASGRKLADIFLDEMLADPMVRLVMEADGVSEMQLRQLYSGSRNSDTGSSVMAPIPETKSPKDSPAIQAAENEGMPTRPN